MSLHAVDWIFILGYFALIFGIAYWAYLKEKQAETSEGYFLAGRNLGWWIVGASVFSSSATCRRSRTTRGPAA